MSISIIFKGTASGYFVAKSTDTKANLLPYVDFGKGPIKSVDTPENGISVTGRLTSGTFAGLFMELAYFTGSTISRNI